MKQLSLIGKLCPNTQWPDLSDRWFMDSPCVTADPKQNI